MLASSTSGVIGEPYLAVNTPRERKMTFLLGGEPALCIVALRHPHLLVFAPEVRFSLIRQNHHRTSLQRSGPVSPTDGGPEWNRNTMVTGEM